MISEILSRDDKPGSASAYQLLIESDTGRISHWNETTLSWCETDGTGRYSGKSEGATGDGETDDTLNLQAVINSVPAGSTIVLSDGTYIVNRVNPGTTDYCLNINKPLEFHLMAGATIKLADGDITNGTDLCTMINIASSDVFITGLGTIDMNKSGQIDTTIGPNISSRLCIGTTEATYSNITISGILIHDALGNGIRVKGLNNASGAITDVNIHNIRMTQCREGVLLHWANIVRCSNNYLSMDNSTGAQDGFETSECDDVEFIGNYVENALGSGFDLFFAGERCICSLNIIKNCGSGVAIGNNTGAGGTGTDYIVTGNVIESPQTVFGIGVYVTTGADRVIIQGNIVRNVVTNAQHAIEVRAGSHVSVLDNTIDTTSTGIGIFILAGLTDLKVSGNKITSTGGVGIRFDGDNSTISDNKLIAIGGDGIELNGDSNLVNGNNMSGEIIDDNGTSNIKINNVVTTSGLNNTGATTPIDHNNIIAGTWTV